MILISDLFITIYLLGFKQEIGDQFWQLEVYLLKSLFTRLNGKQSVAVLRKMRDFSTPGYGRQEKEQSLIK